MIYSITKDMKRRLDEINSNVTLDDVRMIFLDLTDYHNVKVTDINKFYYVQKHIRLLMV